MTRIVVPEATPGIATGVILSSDGSLGSSCLDLYRWSKRASIRFHQLEPFERIQSNQYFRQAETLAVHIWKINTEGTMPDGVQVSAGASAVLIIAVLLFNFGARAIGKRLYRK